MVKEKKDIGEGGISARKTRDKNMSGKGRSSLPSPEGGLGLLRSD